MNISKFKVLCLLLIFFVGLCACTSDETISPYPIIDSGMAATNNRPDIVWLDDGHVLFVGKKHITSEEDPALMIWEIGNGFEHYKTNANGICYSQGMIRYVVHKSALHTRNNSTIFQGPFRQEKQVDQSGARYFDKLNCRSLDYHPAERYGRPRKYLLEDHGYLDLVASPYGDSHSASPVLFYKKGMNDPIEMPFNNQQISSIHIQYYPFKQAYLIYGGYKNQNALIKQKSLAGAKPQPLWWLYVNGEVEPVNIPPGPWLLGGGTFLRATKEGFFIAYLGGYKSTTRTSGQGAYFIQGNEITKVMDGRVMAPAVSPGGCRVAYSQAPTREQDRGNKDNRRTLKIMNFCKKIK